MKDSFIRLNIALKPPKEIEKKVISLSQEISKMHKAHFVLDGKNFYPHITVYSPEIPSSNIDKILYLAKECSNYLKINLSFKEVNHTKGFIVVYFKHDLGIMNFHKKILQQFNPFRENHLSIKQKSQEYRSQLTKKQTANLDKYGYVNCMDLYKPHLTITRLYDEKLAKDIIKGISWNIDKFIAEKLGVFKMGDHGTCIELVKKFNLK